MHKENYSSDVTKQIGYPDMVFMIIIILERGGGGIYNINMITIVF